ncbi:kinesin-like protein KIF16B [Hippocampus zosterae]|uniref:kinesin-like protein KIF16B n=1 Tax=Hippocampus zosterae TaxID=109293 RepID=UPI00223D473E|nr:kinesin-like protein KIF16B [Hippocampus zosterae]
MYAKEEKCLISQICEGLFSKISERSTSNMVSFRTEVRYGMFFNMYVYDLLKKKTVVMESGGLRVREHPRDGPYVENLSKHFVHDYSNMEELKTAGNANRITARTRINDSSSGSHDIFTICFTHKWFDAELPRERMSKIHLVDLAGSERADTTQTSGIRLKEGANINKSLITLGNVMSVLGKWHSKQDY